MQNEYLEFEDRYFKVSKKFYIMQGRRDALRDSLKDLKDKQKSFIKKLEVFDKCIKVFEALGEIKKQQIKNKIEKLVTRGLRTIFERDDYRFEFDMELKRGVMTAKPMLYSKFQGNEMCTYNILDSHGGGIVDIISFLLQIIVLLSFSNTLERIIICDEPFSKVSREDLNNTAEFLKQLANLSNLQIIMITHKNEFMDIADKVYEVKLNSKQETVIQEV